jgi:RNA-directed DNA polymerase
MAIWSPLESLPQTHPVNTNSTSYTRFCYIVAGVISPLLANIYLHYAIDEWFEKVVKPHYEGDAIICRYADDFVFAFQNKDDAEKFYRVLPKRLERFKLEVAQEKTNCKRFSRFEPGLNHCFTFLSFEFHWDRDKGGKPRLFRRTARKKLQEAKRGYTTFIKESRHMKTPLLLDKLTQKLRGYYNYFGVIGNLGDLYQVYSHVVELLYKWLNRRSGRKSLTWAQLKRLIAYRSLVNPVCKALNVK